MRSWGWLLQYGGALLVALILGTALGQVGLFKDAAFFGTRFRAAHLAQFLGYGSALLLLWQIGHRASLELPDDKSPRSVLRHLITPLTTLLVIAGSYKVLLLLLAPMFDKTTRAFYDWTFVVGIIAVAVWLTWTWFCHSASLGAAIDDAHSASLSCPDCNLKVPHRTKFCPQCGHELKGHAV